MTSRVYVEFEVEADGELILSPLRRDGNTDNVNCYTPASTSMAEILVQKQFLMLYSKE